MRLVGILLALCLLACGSSDGDGGTDATTATTGGDGDTDDTEPPGPPDDPGPTPASTAHCEYVPVPATAGAGGTVTAGAVTVGVAEDLLGLPLGSALGGNTSRAVPLGKRGYVDSREVEICGKFTPSVGIESLPRAKAVAITAGDETVVLLHTDTIFADDTITHDLAGRLGPDYAGKVIWTTSHTHTAPEQYSADSKLQIGGGVFRASNRALLLDRLTVVAQRALDARVPAQIGIATDDNFDPDHRVSFDRRDENDFLWDDREKKDDFLAVIRIDTADGAPLAVLPIFGVHAAILSDDTALWSTDVSGMYERLIEEQFDREVLVMHLQGAAGDVLAESSRHLRPGDGEKDWDFARSEENARWALPAIMAAWERAGDELTDTIAMELVTQSVEVGPNWETFTVRDGALSYAPFDLERVADGVVLDGSGAIASPIDEFNAPFGAGLCGEPEARFGAGQMPGVEPLDAYRSCARLPIVTDVLGRLLDFEFEGPPVCSSTRTTVSAWRLGDYLLATAPGEPVSTWARRLRELSPVAADKTLILGYAQGHIGYLLSAIDWLQAGYEPSINLWGPLEGELIAERLADVMALAVTDEREDAAAGGTDRLAGPMIGDTFDPTPDAAPLAGTVPNEVPEQVWFRTERRATGQPPATVPRVTGVAQFTWIGADPLAGTPSVTLEREVDGVFEPVRRRSGRPVVDHEFLVLWTPLPLEQSDDPRVHYYTAEWQALSWVGAPGLEGLDARPGAPLGRYRFSVEGPGYAVASDPFEVVAGPLSVRATRADAEIEIDVAYDARRGWRLLAMDGVANRRLPITAGPLTVELTFSDREPTVVEGVVATNGIARVTPPEGATLTSIRVLDRFGNAGSTSAP